MEQEGENKIILLIDDDILSRLLISEMLLKFHYRIVECETVDAAISLFNDHVERISLILVDLKFSDEDKWNILSRLKNERFQIPAIAIAAMEPEELKRKSKAAGFSTYIPKPVNYYEFQELVDFYLSYVSIKSNRPLNPLKGT